MSVSISLSPFLLCNKTQVSSPAPPWLLAEPAVDNKVQIILTYFVVHHVHHRGTKHLIYDAQDREPRDEFHLRGRRECSGSCCTFHSHVAQLAYARVARRDGWTSVRFGASQHLLALGKGSKELNFDVQKNAGNLTMWESSITQRGPVGHPLLMPGPGPPKNARNLSLPSLVHLQSHRAGIDSTCNEKQKHT